MIKVFQIPSNEMEKMYPQSPFMYGKGEKLFNIDKHITKYVHVADLDVDTLDEAYEVGNIGPEAKYTRYKSMHSVSVGDILVDENNKPFVVADFGFDELDHDEVLV